MDNVNYDIFHSLADKPIIMTMDLDGQKNSAVSKIADDAIVFTGGKSLSSLIFPYMTRAVLETEAREINTPMKLAAAKALDELIKINGLETMSKSAQSRDMNSITSAIIKAAIDSGVGRKVDFPEDSQTYDFKVVVPPKKQEEIVFPSPIEGKNVIQVSKQEYMI